MLKLWPGKKATIKEFDENRNLNTTPTYSTASAGVYSHFSEWSIQIGNGIALILSRIDIAG